MDTVAVEFRKWDGSLHWHWDAVDLGEDVHGRWLYAPAGTSFARGDEPKRIAAGSFVKLVRPGAWWSAVWNADPDPYEVYVDIISPAEWSDSKVSMVDLDLDVVRTRNAETLVLDEDEFIEHSQQMAYPDSVIAAARSATAWVAIQVERQAEPFGAAGARWLETGQGLGFG